MTNHRRFGAGLILAGLISACGDSSPLENTAPVVEPDHRISATAGTGLSGLYGNFVSGVPEIRVTDKQGQPLPGVAVTFAALGGGRVTGAATMTDSLGLARPTGWRLGMSGAQSLQVSAADASPITVTATASAPPAGTFRIHVRYAPGTEPTLAQQAAFDAAAQVWARIILRGGAPYLVYEDAGCGDIRGETVDGVVITADLKAIDGEGSVLGSAGPCILRDVGLLPAQGFMQFDTADLAMLENTGRLGQVILHEMGHVLGLGTLWEVGAGAESHAYLLRAPEDDPTFQGLASRAAMFGLAGALGYGGKPVPVENTGSSGTRFAHWRESVFGSELMTGWLNSGNNPLSALTIAQFKDLGYVVNDALGETYTFAAAVQASVVAPLALIEKPLTTPLIVINRTGRLVRTVGRALM